MVVECWRKNLTNVQVELKQPRVIDVSPIDFVSGEPIDRKGTPTKRQLMTQSKMGAFAFTWFFSCVSDKSPWVLSACPCSLADFFFHCDSLSFAQSSPCEYTPRLRPNEAGQACSLSEI